MGRKYVAALDQGTTSTRCILFDHSGAIAGMAQREHSQRYPKPGWVEHDPMEIWEAAQSCMDGALRSCGAEPGQIAALGITNQRETSVLWNARTGLPLRDAIVWQDTRTDALCAEIASKEGPDKIRKLTGLPLASYFSATKLRWMLDDDPEARRAARSGEALFGTIDSWLVYKLSGGLHRTDGTNASRTMLFDIRQGTWSPELLAAFDIPSPCLPMIAPSSCSGPYGETSPGCALGAGIPITGVLGDQQAALFGQACCEPGEAKNTYGTGCFLLMHTGRKLVDSRNGLLGTVAFLDADGTIEYALEGSVAIAGALVQWVRDRLGLIKSAPEIDALAQSVPDSGGCYFVPAFSGLFAPHWRPDARGTIVGLSHYTGAGHLARAVLEATAFQTKELFDAMAADSGIALKALKVDGGMTASEPLMRFQSDILGIEVQRPKVRETTALGAAYAAGLAVGFWKDRAEIASHWSAEATWSPSMPESERSQRYGLWKKAVEKSMGWLP